MNYFMIIPTVAVLMTLWVVGWANSFTIAGFIHILPAVAGLLILGKFLWARKPGAVRDINQVFRSKSNPDAE